MRARIGKRFPDHGIIARNSAASAPTPNSSGLLDSGRRHEEFHYRRAAVGHAHACCTAGSRYSADSPAGARS